jgi:hypothetical protein
MPDAHVEVPAGMLIMSPFFAVFKHAKTSPLDASAAIKLGLLPPQAANAFAAKRLVMRIVVKKTLYKFFILHLHTTYKSQIRGVTSVTIITEMGE